MPAGNLPMTVRPWSVIGAACLVVMLGGLAAPCAAQSAANTPRRTVTDGLPGAKIFSPQRWGIVGVEIVNPGDDSVEVLSGHFFPGDAQLQFARQLWIPPRAKRSSWYPIRPSADPVKNANMSVQSLLIDRSRGNEVLLAKPGGTLIQEG